MRAPDRTYRSLKGLEQTASTSRVLNLAALTQRHGDDPEHRRRPLFDAPALAGSLVIKHRLRPAERDLFHVDAYTVTKLILPFERSDLSLGGRGFFVGDRGWLETLAELRGGIGDFDRDVKVMEALEELPSLDPFLLREHLTRRGFDVSPTYFEITPADVLRMKRFVGQEISRLIELAYRSASVSEANRSRLVEALLSDQPDERLEPLRLTLKLQGASYREGIFAWKGFLYYKWVLQTQNAALKAVITELPQVKMTGPADAVQRQRLNQLRERLSEKIDRQIRQMRLLLRTYDSVFERLTVDGDAVAFRDFLLESPKLFLQLGESCGAVSHIASFWRYQFPTGQPLTANVDMLLDVLQGFELSLGPDDEERVAA